MLRPPDDLVRQDMREALGDTAALAPPERDVALIAARPGDIDRYQEAAARELDSAVITLYRLRWYLDDLASAIRMFRNRHCDTPDTRRWWQGLAPRREQLPRCNSLAGLST